MVTKVSDRVMMMDAETQGQQFLGYADLKWEKIEVNVVYKNVCYKPI